MTTCAVVDNTNTVINIIVAEPTDLAPDGNILVEVTEDTNPVSIGYSYIPSVNKFKSPAPYPSWILDTTSYIWNAPIPYPNDGKDYYWDELTTSWTEIINGN